MNRMYFDGGAAPNPGRMHICVVIDGEAHFERLGYGTNNEAEWMALCWGMMIAASKGITELEVIGDSQLIVNQANGTWKIKKAELAVFKEQYDGLLKQFKKVTLSYTPREKNVAGHHIEAMIK